MSKERNNDGDQTKRPSFIAYQVREADEDKSFFNRIGAAFAHKDGQGHTIDLDAMPVNGRVVLRTPQERLQEMKEERTTEPSSRRRDTERGR